MSAFLWCLFEETPRPQPLPTFPFPNHHPFSVRCQESLGPLVPVGEGPLSSYHDHILIPVPGELGGPPLWTPVSPAMVGSPAASPATFLESIPTDPQRSKSISPVPNSIPPEPEIIDTFPEPRKTYLSRRARGLPPLQCFSSDVGNQAVTLLSQNLAPERRRKGERRCGRFVCFSDFAFPSLRHKHFLHSLRHKHFLHSLRHKNSELLLAHTDLSGLPSNLWKVPQTFGRAGRDKMMQAVGVQMYWPGQKGLLI